MHNFTGPCMDLNFKESPVSYGRMDCMTVRSEVGRIVRRQLQNPGKICG